MLQCTLCAPHLMQMLTSFHVRRPLKVTEAAISESLCWAQGQ